MSIHWSCHELVSGDAEVPLYSYYLSSKQQMCWSDCADAQTDLHLGCSHMQSADFLNTSLKLLFITFLARAMDAISMFSTCKYLN